MKFCTGVVVRPAVTVAALMAVAIFQIICKDAVLTSSVPQAMAAAWLGLPGSQQSLENSTVSILLIILLRKNRKVLRI